VLDQLDHSRRCAEAPHSFQRCRLVNSRTPLEYVYAVRDPFRSSSPQADGAASSSGKLHLPKPDLQPRTPLPGQRKEELIKSAAIRQELKRQVGGHARAGPPAMRNRCSWSTRQQVAQAEQRATRPSWPRRIQQFTAVPATGTGGDATPQQLAFRRTVESASGNWASSMNPPASRACKELETDRGRRACASSA